MKRSTAYKFEYRFGGMEYLIHVDQILYKHVRLRTVLPKKSPDDTQARSVMLTELSAKSVNPI